MTKSSSEAESFFERLPPNPPSAIIGHGPGTQRQGFDSWWPGILRSHLAFDPLGSGVYRAARIGTPGRRQGLLSPGRGRQGGRPCSERPLNPPDATQSPSTHCLRGRVHANPIHPTHVPVQIRRSSPQLKQSGVPDGDHRCRNFHAILDALYAVCLVLLLCCIY